MEIRYKIESMEESGFAYSPDYDYTSIDTDTVAFQFIHNIVPIPDKSELSITMTAEITPKESGEVLAKETVYSVFKIDPYDRVFQIGENEFKTIEPRLIDTFIGIVIGALRGMLVKNLKGTPLSKCILPLIPMDVIHQHTSRISEQ